MMFVIKKGDTSPAVQGILSTSADLTDAAALFVMRDSGGEIVISDVANITSVANKTIVYQWGQGETDIPGKYEAEFRITYKDGRIETFPNVGFISIYIEENISEEVVP